MSKRQPATSGVYQTPDGKRHDWEQPELPMVPTHWAAGQVAPCDGRENAGIVAVHLIVRCACGAAFMSTDAVVALQMAMEHAHVEGVTT